jgi:DNA helicase-2/ATP-dependent DNA helicase PcrA
MNSRITQSFLEAYTGLNEAQKQAVETIDGPVLVIAGPGTGKTQILAARIGNILLKTDARPENILCLTYTDAGTVAMRKRLLQFIGPDAYKVGIFTFHAFCNMVIQENLDHFGIKDLQPISELEQKQLLEKLIDGFDKNHLLKRWTGEIYYDSYRLQKLFQLMKTENWTVEKIYEEADRYIAELPDKEEFRYKRANATKGIKMGDLKQDKIDAEIKKMNELKAAASEFTNYENMMRELKRYDYDDMIIWVLKAFEEHPYMLLRYQERYQYFLVDEFQDTNGSQNAILKSLITNDFNEGKPNVMVVGDDDQSIYRFQGANVQNIMDFWFDYKDQIATIVMIENYRSTQLILDASKHLIEKNFERLINKIQGLSKDLKALNAKYAAINIQPEIIAYPNPAQEATAIAQAIEQLQNEGVPLHEIAVIYRNHRQSEALGKLLRFKNISVNTRKRLDILKSRFIQNILTLLQYIDIESKTACSDKSEELLFQILHYAWFNVDTMLIAEIAIDIRQNNHYKNPLFWRKEIQKVAQKIKPDLFNNENNDRYAALKKLSDDIEYWIKERHNISLQLLIEKIITRGGILNYIMHSPEKIQMLEELHTFYSFVKAETQRDTSLNISGLMDTLKQLDKYDIAITIETTSVAEKGVNFVTAHSSKGLEFEHVFLIGCDKNSWDKPARSGTFTLPETLTAANDTIDESEESRRLFYVAMTRAKKHLHISFSATNADGKDTEYSRFVAELTEQNTLPIQRKSMSDADMMAYNFMVMQEEALPDVQLVEESFLHKVLENYSLSVTDLSLYLKCPVSFYYSKMLKIPQAKNEAMVFGTAVHNALNKFFKKMQDEGKEQFPATEVLLNDFKFELLRHKDAFNTQQDFDRRLQYGLQILPKYLEHYLDTWNKIVKTEIIINASINGIPIKGIIDKLEFTGREVNVVDYKTGQFSNPNTKKKFNPPLSVAVNEDAQLKFEELYGGDYWRQAVFYKIIIDNEIKRDWNVISTEFDFVEPDRKTQLYHKEKVVITPHDVEVVKKQITGAYNQIMNLQFTKGCNEPDCKWCNFVKSAFREIEVGDEEE